MDVLVSLNIALGLVLVYLVFALAVTAFNEGIAAMLSSRARWLRKGIQGLLTFEGRAKREASKEMDNFYKSPFIAYLGQGGLLQGSKPSYIPAWTIVQGLLSSADTAATQAFDNVVAIKQAIGKLPEKSPIKTVLNDLIAQAGTDVDRFRQLVDEWFKTFDAQVSAWYRQKTQYVVLALSLLVVGAMNVDSIAIARQLAHDPQTREAMAREAVAIATQDTPDKLLDTAARDSAKKSFEEAQKAIVDAEKQLASADKGQDVAGRAEAKAKAATALADAKSAGEKAERVWLEEQHRLEQTTVDRIRQLSATGLKLGWTDADLALTGFHVWLAKVVGLLMSALAVSLGAPFWFDILKSVASIRSVGPNIAERDVKPTTT